MKIKCSRLYAVCFFCQRSEVVTIVFNKITVYKTVIVLDIEVTERDIRGKLVLEL